MASGELGKSNPAAIGNLGWGFSAVQVTGVALAFLYFGLPAMVLSAVVTAIVGLAAWLVGK